MARSHHGRDGGPGKAGSVCWGRPGLATPCRGAAVTLGGGGGLWLCGQLSESRRDPHSCTKGSQVAEVSAEPGQPLCCRVERGSLLALSRPRRSGHSALLFRVLSQRRGTHLRGWLRGAEGDIGAVSAPQRGLVAMRQVGGPFHPGARGGRGCPSLRPGCLDGKERGARLPVGAAGRGRPVLRASEVLGWAGNRTGRRAWPGQRGSRAFTWALGAPGSTRPRGPQGGGPDLGLNTNTGRGQGPVTGRRPGNGADSGPFRRVGSAFSPDKGWEEPPRCRYRRGHLPPGAGRLLPRVRCPGPAGRGAF